MLVSSRVEADLAPRSDPFFSSVETGGSGYSSFPPQLSDGSGPWVSGSSPSLACVVFLAQCPPPLTFFPPSPRLTIDSSGQSWYCTAIPKRLTYTHCTAIYDLCNVVKGTLDLNLDLDFSLKMASNLRCGEISFKLVMFSICRPSLVTIGAAVGAATAGQADVHTHTDVYEVTLL